MAGNRPLSPHLGIWKWRVTALISIFHRATGNALAVAGVLAFTWWLVAAALGKEAYDLFSAVAGSPIGWIVWIGLSWSFFQHLLSGLRHLMMDAGWGFELGIARSSATSVFVGAAVLTAAFWALFLFFRTGCALMAGNFQSSSDLKRVRGLGSAKSGVHHWWLQRVTAAANALLLGWFLISLMLMPDLGYASVTAWLANPLVAVPMLLLIFTTFWHARLGMQVLIEDYVPSDGTKLLLLLLSSFFLIGAGALATFSILAIAFGA